MENGTPLVFLSRRTLPLVSRPQNNNPLFFLFFSIFFFFSFVSLLSLFSVQDVLKRRKKSRWLVLCLCVRSKKHKGLVKQERESDQESWEKGGGHPRLVSLSPHLRDLERSCRGEPCTLEVWPYFRWFLLSS